MSFLFAVRAIFESPVNEVILGPFGMDLQILSCLLSGSINKEKKKLTVQQMGRVAITDLLCLYGLPQP